MKSSSELFRYDDEALLERTESHDLVDTKLMLTWPLISPHSERFSPSDPDLSLLRIDFFENHRRTCGLGIEAFSETRKLVRVPWRREEDWIGGEEEEERRRDFSLDRRRELGHLRFWTSETSFLCVFLVVALWSELSSSFWIFFVWEKYLPLDGPLCVSPLQGPLEVLHWKLFDDGTGIIYFFFFCYILPWLIMNLETIFLVHFINKRKKRYK